MSEEEKKRLMEERGQTEEGIPTGEVVPDLGKDRGEKGPQ